MKPSRVFHLVITGLLRAGLVVALFSAGWAISPSFPYRPLVTPQAACGDTTLQIILRPSSGIEMLDIPVELYPIDIVAVRHEYFTERRAGKRFDDFLSERMKGRSPITSRLDMQGQTSVVISPGMMGARSRRVEEDL